MGSEKVRLRERCAQREIGSERDTCRSREIGPERDRSRERWVQRDRFSQCRAQS